MRDARLSAAASGDASILGHLFWSASGAQFGSNVAHAFAAASPAMRALFEARGEAAHSGSRPHKLSGHTSFNDDTQIVRAHTALLNTANASHAMHLVESAKLPGHHDIGTAAIERPDHSDTGTNFLPDSTNHETFAIVGGIAGNAITHDVVMAPHALDHLAMSMAMNAMQHGPLQHFDTQLASLYYENSSSAQAMKGFTASVGQNANSLHTIGGHEYVSVDVTAKDGNGAHLMHQLENLGMKFGAHYGASAGGILDVHDLGALAQLGNVAEAHESALQTHAGIVTTQADHAQHNDSARDTYGVDGTGLKIGVISDSFNKVAPTNALGHADNMAEDQANGDLPADTTIYQDDPFSGGTDEGRGMAQLIHDLAPGASIEFATAEVSETGFAGAIQNLANDGCKVIVDDVSYFDEPYYQEGVVAQAVDNVTENNGVTYFTSAANDADHGFEANWASSAATYSTDTLAKMDSAGDTVLAYTLPSGWSVPVTLQWDSPSVETGGNGSQNDLNLYVFNDAAMSSLKTSSVTNNVNGNAYERADIINTSGSTKTYYIAVGLHAGATPGEFKLISSDNGLEGQPFGASDINFNSGTVSGHAAARDAIAVGAAYFGNTPAYGVDPAVKEFFSSVGPTRILFDISGNRLAAPFVSGGPQITAVDGGNTSFFGTTGSIDGDLNDGDIYKNFYGTSAAAPDAAATAALMLEARASLDHLDILHLLEDTAHDMDAAGYDTNTGYGLVDAKAAVGAAKTLTITGNINHQVLTGTHLGDTFSFAAGFSNAVTVDGGVGSDTLALDMTLSGSGVHFTGTTLKSIEKITVANGHDYKLVEADSNVSSGHTLTVTGNTLDATHKLTFDGSAETNGLFVLTGGKGDDVLTGGAKNDRLTGNAGADRLTGGDGHDTFAYSVVGSSTNAKYDTIVGFDFQNVDKFDLWYKVTGANSTVSGGKLSTASFNSDLSKALTSQDLGAHHAVLFKPTSGTLAGQTFLVVDANGHAGYQAGADLVFHLTGAEHTSALNAADFT